MTKPTNNPSDNQQINNSNTQSTKNESAVKINDTSGDKPQALSWKPVETKSQG